MVNSERKITLHDVTLRDGQHPMRHRISLANAEAIAQALDAAGMPLIQITHGEGLGGGSVNYGFPSHSDEEYFTAVVPLMESAHISALLLPGIGTVAHLKMAHRYGVRSIYIATHCTEADVAEEHIREARKLGLDTVGFLMMSHMNDVTGIVGQAKLMESYGANCIYMTDSAGHMLTGEVHDKISALRDVLNSETELGFHGHNNLSMGVANSIEAVKSGANRIDASCAGLGAGAGNTATEVFVAVANLEGIDTGVDLFKVQDVAEDLVVPMRKEPQRISRDALTIGYAGVYGSFLGFAWRAAKKYGVPARDILLEMGRAGMVGGQEDMVLDTAMRMARERGNLER